jgi:RHH-type proline utilization regulon transcriptional repressor/proline dehydrogenase/delta 1-pyrroline-5-carboxylate dehydrogenase
LNKIINLIKVTDESDEQFLQKVEKGLIRRIRVASKPSKELIIAARNKRCFIDDSKVLSNGRYELLNYLRELSISYDYHRFGNLGARESELRKPLI